MARQKDDITEMVTIYRQVKEAKRLARQYVPPECICRAGTIDLGCRACTGKWRPEYESGGARRW